MLNSAETHIFYLTLQTFNSFPNVALYATSNMLTSQPKHILAFENLLDVNFGLNIFPLLHSLRHLYIYTVSDCEKHTFVYICEKGKTNHAFTLFISIFSTIQKASIRFRALFWS